MRVLTWVVSAFLLAGLPLSIGATTLLPPKYLSVNKWQKCVGSMTKGDAKFVCLPSSKPKHCSKRSWKKLIKLKELNSCPEKSDKI